MVDGGENSKIVSIQRKIGTYLFCSDLIKFKNKWIENKLTLLFLNSLFDDNISLFEVGIGHGFLNHFFVAES